VTLHPDIQAVLDADPLPGPPPWEQPLQEMRAEAEATAAEMSGPGEPVGRVGDVVVPGPAGDIHVRVYSPASDAAPLLVFCHGGGWVTGSVDSYDPFCRRLANATGAVTLSVSYRLAPEHSWPSAVDDADGVLSWAREHADELGGDPDRIGVAGDSAGGEIAATIARRRSDVVRFQALVYPAIDPTRSSESHREFATGFRLTSEEMGWYWRQYLGDAPPAAVYADGLRGAPAAYVLTADCDPLRDEGEIYAERLRAAGVPVELRRWPGTVHGFVRWFAVTDLAAAAVEELAQAFRVAMALPSGPP
jgi:acetyl esterase